MTATVKALRILSLYWIATVSCNGLLSPSSYPSTTTNYYKYRPSSITLWAANSASTSKQTNERRKGKSIGNGKWDRRRGNNNKKKQHGPRPPPKPRPILTVYEEQRNDSVNRQRLSPNTAINCEHFGTCPGCVVENSIGQVDIVRSAARFFSSTAIRKNRLDVEQSGEDWVVEEEDDGFYHVVIPSDVAQWRTQAKLVAAPRSSSWAKDGCVFGLYKRASHDVLEIPNCQVHHPSINRAVQVLEKATQQAGTPAFNRDSRDANGLRYVQLQVERITGKISLTLVFGVADVKSAQPSLSRLTKQLAKLEPALWHSVWCHCNDSPGNNIFSRNPRSWHRLSGPEFVREPFPVGDMGWLYFSPLAFRQGNMDGFDVLANDVARAIPGGSKVCELYAGVGLLGLTALMYHHPSNPLVWVRCSDENPANPRCFTRSLQSIPREITEHPKQVVDEPSLTLRDIMEKMEQGEEFETQGDLADRVGSKATYTVLSAGAALRAGDALGADVLVVDPPRKGLEDDVLEELCKPFNPKQPNVESPNMLTIDDYLVNWTNDVQTLIYVSCGFDALARDTEKLLSSQGGWKLESATGYVLFPGSNHVETLAIFKRK